MQKTAQKRSILNKLREMSNVSGIAAEKFFNPEFERVMNSLRATDDKIRAIATGKDIEGQDPGDPVSLKANLNRREYMTSIAFLGRFHKKLYDMTQSIDALNSDVDQVHHDFLFKDLDDDQKKHLSEMKSRFAVARGYNLVSQGGIMDFLHNMSSERGRALAAWEKRYPKQVSKLKKDTANLISKSESALSNILSALKEMASARAARKVDDYVKSAAKLGSVYGNYDKAFRDHYTSNVKGFLEKQELLSPTKKVEDAGLGKQEVSPSAPPSEVPDLEVTDNEVIPLVQNKNTDRAPAPDFGMEEMYEDVAQPGSATFAPPKVPSNLPIPPTPASPQITEYEDVHEDELEEIPPAKSAHKRFMSSLEAMAGEKPELLAAHIRSYAKSIQASDMETAVTLLKLAKQIKE
jgi:hypothetical protein